MSAPLPKQFIENERRNFAAANIAGAGEFSGVMWSDWERAVKRAKYASVCEANTRLRNAAARLVWGEFNLGNTSHQSKNDYAEKMAAHVKEEIPDFPEWSSVEDIQAQFEDVAALGSHCLTFELSPCYPYESLRGIYARLIDPVFWRRKLNQIQKIRLEEIARDYDLVHKRAGAYVSNFSLDNQRSNAKKNKTILENTYAVNEWGECYSLADLQARSVSNPELRRMELMTRIAGFQVIAEQDGHAAVFWTITCPSKYHSHYSNGKKNEKYNGATVRDAQAYLNGVWARVRAWMDRNEINVYGFRVAEPHHDGCPHWHILVFGEKEQLRAATARFKAEALRVDGDESGAQKARFKTEWIAFGKSPDGRTLSAAGYIAKYISKSIDGAAVGGDMSLDMNGQRVDMGQDSEIGAERVTAWARVNRIRQFQQIGGASVSVWREIRKLNGLVGDDDDEGDLRLIVEKIEAETQTDAAAAWAVFNRFNGSGRDQRLKLWRDDLRPVSHYFEFVEHGYSDDGLPEIITRDSFEAGALGAYLKNGYGEAVSKVRGLVFDGAKKIKTRLHEWFTFTKREEMAAAENGRGRLEFRARIAEFSRAVLGDVGQDLIARAAG